MRRYFYSAPINRFLEKENDSILGELAMHSSFALETTQRDAWLEEIQILKETLHPYEGHGHVYFEYSIPRLGKRIDVVCIVGPVLFIFEFKVGEKRFTANAVDQVYDYALDLKNFHESSHHLAIVPVLIATAAEDPKKIEPSTQKEDRLFSPIKTNARSIGKVISLVLSHVKGNDIQPDCWEQGRYSPTPTIIVAAKALYNGHSVADISRNDASAINLKSTSETISEIIQISKSKRQKSICFVTGVPGAGKTLVGLNIATSQTDEKSDLQSVFLSGNGPLVAILREALARDQVQQQRQRGIRVTKSQAASEVKAFIQNVHHFRDECLADKLQPPIEHIAIFDEAQRAWDHDQTTSFMRQKRKTADFDQSEPEFLISCLDRHQDWAVIVCLVGGGQEINTGEAGIGEWIESLDRSFPDWHIYLSPMLAGDEYYSGSAIQDLSQKQNVTQKKELHLAVSMRSFRAENVSTLVKHILDLNIAQATETLQKIGTRYPIVVTRSLPTAKQWIRSQARGSERYGIVASSQAQRLKPHAIDVKTKIDPIHWFLNGKEDIRSSYYLEDVVTQFKIQGLEIDWACVVWDADFRHTNEGWRHWSFQGKRWNQILKTARQRYLKNAYRVLLTRARQGMVIVVPNGDPDDPTRRSEFYDPTFEYLKQIGLQEI